MPLQQLLHRRCPAAAANCFQAIFVLAIDELLLSSHVSAAHLARHTTAPHHGRGRLRRVDDGAQLFRVRRRGTRACLFFSAPACWPLTRGAPFSQQAEPGLTLLQGSFFIHPTATLRG
jgi:hypothetical protein